MSCRVNRFRAAQRGVGGTGYILPIGTRARGKGAHETFNKKIIVTDKVKLPCERLEHRPKIDPRYHKGSVGPI